MIVHLRERLVSGSAWMDGRRPYRTLDDYQLPMSAFKDMRATGDRRLDVPTGSPKWHEERCALLTHRMAKVERAAATGELIDVAIERVQ